MAISTIGNITYINQNMQTTSAAHANAMQRGDFIPREFEDKLREIEEVRPTETENKINKDSQNKNSQDMQEEEAKKKRATESDGESGAESSDLAESDSADLANPTQNPTDGHLLNIKV
ncbi:hypothetical protein BKN38_04445 [Helicobacter sp. CLO-3]|uniref:hypothetical protein n=1 Tax=unclassified Helicobacter TaxID=2593540 RepID=UPI000804BCC1|nr:MULTISPECIES: hypothetical protein [unclassified Helicobacter]OBV29945.1 hypothetical protein BA723_03425 [Helicobacter sp. CLO-3]OHU83946.1 hypothetical protein BKN38_04445 [Helicobacter sp. CLO-3]